MNKRKLLCDISNAFGPSGFEDDVIYQARRYTPEGAVVSEDSMRNFYIRRPQDEGADKPIVMLDAHSDEVGFMVQAIKPNGLLSIIQLGRWNNNTLPAHTVLVKNREGKLITGIITSKPPHFMSEAEAHAPLEMSNIFIDVGACSAEEVKQNFKISIGAPVAPDSRFTYNESSGIMMGKAFDCRAGCTCVIDAMNQLFDKELAIIPVGALASQEEVGTRGAKVTARTVQPSAAIAFEGCPADDNFAEDWNTHTALKRGPMLRHIDNGMITNPRFMRFALDIAEELGIPVQEAVRGNGMTNGAPIHLAGHGIPTIVIGIPVRYIHTHVGYAASEDLDNSIKLALAVINKLTAEVIASF